MREVPYWRVGLHSSTPGGSGSNGNRITGFSFPLHGFHEARIEPEFLQTHFFVLIIALLDLGGISFLLSCFAHQLF